MADFERTQMEVQNTLDPEENAVVIVDSTTPAQKAVVTAAGELKVLVSGGGTAGQMVQTGDVQAGGDVGRIIAGTDGTNYRFVATDPQGHLQVDVLSGGGGGTQVTDGQAIVSGETAVIIAGTDGSNFQHLSVDSNGHLNVLGPLTDAELRATPVPVSGTFWQATQPVSGTFWQATQPVSGPLTDTELRATPVPISATDLDIRDLIHASDSVRVGDGTNLVDVLDDSGTYRLQVEAKIAAGGATQPGRIVDGNGDPIDVQEGVAIPAGVDSGLQIAGPDLADIGRVVTVTQDGEDGKNRLEISGKISVSAPPPPPAATPQQVAADTPLSVSGTDDTDYEITTGETFTIQSVVSGAEGDPTEKGAKIEIFYIDGAAVSHVVERIYLTGQTVQTFPDTSIARDGTAMVGVAGAGLGVLRVRRHQFGGGTRELEAVIRGFEE